MPKVIGNTVGVPNPKTDWAQTDETKANYIKNKPEIYTKSEIDGKLGDIKTALDTIIAEQENIMAIQDALIGGGSV